MYCNLLLCIAMHYFVFSCIVIHCNILQMYCHLLVHGAPHCLAFSCIGIYNGMFKMYVISCSLRLFDGQQESSINRDVKSIQAVEGTCIHGQWHGNGGKWGQ